MHLPEIDKYAHCKSVFHSWDPRIKLLTLSLFVFFVVTLSSLWKVLFALLIAVIFVRLSRIPFKFVFKHLQWVFLFSIILFIIMSLTVENGLQYGFLIVLRAITSVVLLFPMIGTMEFNTTQKALQSLKVPNSIIQIIMFTYRYIFTFIEETRRTIIAAKSRGLKGKTSIGSMKITANIVGMLLIRSFERTERIYNAMISRGYNGTVEICEDFHMDITDVMKAVLIITIGIIIFII